jgi:hypothetical protein
MCADVCSTSYTVATIAAVEDFFGGYDLCRGESGGCLFLIVIVRERQAQFNHGWHTEGRTDNLVFSLIFCSSSLCCSLLCVRASRGSVMWRAVIFMNQWAIPTQLTNPSLYDTTQLYRSREELNSPHHQRWFLVSDNTTERRTIHYYLFIPIIHSQQWKNP